MLKVRALVKRNLPKFARDMMVEMGRLSRQPEEDVFLHDYNVVSDPGIEPRLTLVIPSLNPEKMFAGITTAIEVFLEIGKLLGVQLRILVDTIEAVDDFSMLERLAGSLNLDVNEILIIPRTEDKPTVPVRPTDLFVSFSWWTTLNLKKLLQHQSNLFEGVRNPLIYIIQDYEPQFYPFSSTHMLARTALDSDFRYWGMFNTDELYVYFKAQGHCAEREFVFEPRLSNSLRTFLNGEDTSKQRRILVYGRPTVQRNCFPAIEKGLKKWSQAYPEFSDWEVVSAGLPHEPIPFGANRTLKSLGKLSLEEYGALLKTTAVGLSLMSSPHPSYPPLEMAHFGIRTITNSYANKNLSSAHENIISVKDIAPETIAEALAMACKEFNQSPASGWRARTHRPSFLSVTPSPSFVELAEAVRKLWASEQIVLREASLK